LRPDAAYRLLQRNHDARARPSSESSSQDEGRNLLPALAGDLPRTNTRKEPRGASHAHPVVTRPDVVFPCLRRIATPIRITPRRRTDEGWRGPRDRVKDAPPFFPLLRHKVQLSCASCGPPAHGASGRRSPPWRLPDTHCHRCVRQQDWRLLLPPRLSPQDNGPIKILVPTPSREG
jgi:hypothetical protein